MVTVMSKTGATRRLERVRRLRVPWRLAYAIMPGRKLRRTDQCMDCIAGSHYTGEDMGEQERNGLAIISTIALQRTVEELGELYHRRHGVHLIPVFGATAALLERIQGGLRADLALLTQGGVDQLASTDILAHYPLPARPLACSRIAMAVKAGAAHPDIHDIAALRSALLKARAVAYSRAGASGIHTRQLLEQLGIAELVNSRAVIVPEGFTATRAVSGEAELAIQQVSELLSVDGIELVGLLPEEVQSVTYFSAGVFSVSPYREEAERFVDFLLSPEGQAVQRRRGLEAVATI